MALPSRKQIGGHTLDLDEDEAIDAPADEDTESYAGHAPSPESDDDVDEIYKKAFGNKPRGNTIAEEIEKDEEDIRNT